jgi:hypothetical protein
MLILAFTVSVTGKFDVFFANGDNSTSLAVLCSQKIILLNVDDKLQSSRVGSNYLSYSGTNACKF